MPIGKYPYIEFHLKLKLKGLFIISGQSNRSPFVYESLSINKKVINQTRN